MPSNPFRGTQFLGYVPSAPATSTLALNAAATWLAFSFLAPPGGKTVTSVRLYLTAVAGTLQTTDLTCDVYSDTPGNPNASLGSVNLGSAPVGAGWVTFTGLNVVTTAGTQYWIVLKNADGTPGTNFATFGYLAGALPSLLSPKSISNKSGSNCICSTTNSGTAWTANNNGAAGFRLGYGDGSYDGLPLSAASTAAIANKAFGSNLVGVQFATPAGPSLKVAGLAFQLEAVGTPTGYPVFSLYQGATLLGSTPNLVCNVPATTASDWFFNYFSSDITLSPSTTYRAVFGDSAADSGTNYFLAGNLFSYDTDSNSLPLLPFEGTTEVATYNGSTWTATQGYLTPFALILDSGGEFLVSSGGPLVIGG